MTRIGLFLPNWIGDVCMATPTIRAVAEHFRRQGDVEIVGIMRPYVGKVLEGTPWIDEQIFCEKRSSDPQRRARKVIQRLRSARLDVAILMPNSLRSAALAWLGGARRRVGYACDGRGILLTDRLPADGEMSEAPLVFRLLKLAEVVGCDVLDPRTELATTAADESHADGVWRQFGLQAGHRVVTLNCGAATFATKRWPLDRFGALARRIVQELEHDVLVMCGPGEEAIADEVVAHSGGNRVFSMSSAPLDLGTAKACIRRSRMMVSTDSGPRHLAVAFARPVVTLFGPVSPVESYNSTLR